VPKAAAKITDDAEEFLTFFDFPAEHWQHLKTSNDQVDLLLGQAQNPGHQGPRLPSPEAGDDVKLLESAQHRWRAVNGPHLVALVRAGARFDKG
jgi:putative transposase